MSEPDLSQPDSPLAEACNEALSTLEEVARAHGYEGLRGLLIVHAEQAPVGQPDSTSAAFGLEEQRDIVPDLAHHFIAAARAFGLRVELHTIGDRRDS